MHESQSFWAPLLDCLQYTIVLAKVIIAKSEGRVKGESKLEKENEAKNYQK